MDAAKTMRSYLLSCRIPDRISPYINRRLGIFLKTFRACSISTILMSMPVTFPLATVANLAESHPLPQPTSSILQTWPFLLIYCDNLSELRLRIFHSLKYRCLGNTFGSNNTSLSLYILSSFNRKPIYNLLNRSSIEASCSGKKPFMIFRLCKSHNLFLKALDFRLAIFPNSLQQFYFIWKLIKIYFIAKTGD